MDGHDRIFDRDPALLAELAKGAGHGFAGCACHGGHFLVGKQERETECSIIHVLADLVGELEEQTSEAGGHGFRQGDAAGVLESEAVFLADALDGAHLGLFVIAEKAEEAVAFDGAELGRGQRFSGDFVDPMGEHCIEAEHGAWTGDTYNHLSVLGASGGQLDVSGANEIEAAGFVALSEERCFGGQGYRAGCQFKIGQNSASQGAEPPGTPVCAGGTADGRLPIYGLLPHLGYLELFHVRHGHPHSPAAKRIYRLQLSDQRGLLFWWKHFGPRSILVA